MGILHDLTDRHVFVSLIGGPDGKMHHSQKQSNRKDKLLETPVNPGDTVKVFQRINLIGKIKDLTIIALEINAKNVELNNCKIKAPDEATEHYCGGRLV